MDFRLGSDWDIIWNNGPLKATDTTQPYTETVAQRLRIRLMTFREEWFLDTTYGIPYFSRILGVKQTSKDAVDLIFQQEILKESGVKEITEFESTFKNRQYSMTFKVKVANGDTTSSITVQSTN